jgi:imidazolonepropionase-like amidohydrolase
VSRRGIVVAFIIALAVTAAAVGWLTSADNAPAKPEPPQTSPSGAAPVTVIRGATLIDGTGATPIADAAIVIRGSRIAALGPSGVVEVPSGARIIEAQGKFIIPGLADMHNHLRNGISLEWENPRPNLARLLAWGVTMTFTPGMEDDAFAWLRTQVTADDSAPYAHFWGSGPMFLMAENPSVDYSPRTPEEARLAVRGLKRIGVDAVKVIYDDSSWATNRVQPLLPEAVLGAIIDEAHVQGLPVYVHAPMLSQAKTALRAGADGLLHGIISDPIDDEFITLMRKNNAFYVSTLSLFESCADLAGWSARQAAFDQAQVIAAEQYATLRSPEMVARAERSWANHAGVQAQLPVARSNLKRVFDAGIPVVTGTDTGILGVVLGPASLLELLLHVEAGLKPDQVLQAATINAARMVGRDGDLGTLEPGKLADMLILDADPLADLGNARRIHRIVKGGVTYDPADLHRLANLPHEELLQQLQKAGSPEAS